MTGTDDEENEVLSLPLCLAGPSAPSAVPRLSPALEKAPTAAAERTKAEYFAISLHNIYYGELKGRKKRGRIFGQVLCYTPVFDSLRERKGQESP